MYFYIMYLLYLYCRSMSDVRSSSRLLVSYKNDIKIVNIVIKYKSLGIGHQYYEMDLFIESSELEVEYPKFNNW